MKGLGRRRICLDYRQVGSRIRVTMEKEKSGVTSMGTWGKSFAYPAMEGEWVKREAEGRIKRGRKGKELVARRQLKILLWRAKATV